MSKTRKLTAIAAWAITVAFFVGVVIPLAAQRMSVNMSPFKSQWGSFLLKDQNGQRHVGFMAFGDVLYNADFFEYGYEAPKGKDLTPWAKKITDIPRDKITNIDGFVWSDKGFLWGDSQNIGPQVDLKEGSRLDLKRPVGKSEQMELTIPGAPWDFKTQTQSFFGTFPSYRYELDNENFKFDLMLTAKVPQWVMYEEGRPFQAGDHGRGSMNETAGDITGIIIHKKTGERFEVSGVGLLEHAVGVPWSWLDWGGSNWNDVHFPGGWHGSLWKAIDDWQWGNNPYPENGWIWDPELKKIHYFHRTEVVEIDMVTDKISGISYPKRSVWRAYSPEATLEIENILLTFKPRETVFPKFGALQMAYGTNAVNGHLIRRDGSVVELRDGTGTMEHFKAVVPDYIFWGPFSLVMLVLSWSAYAGVVRREAKRSVAPPVIACFTGLLAVFCLYIAWL